MGNPPCQLPSEPPETSDSVAHTNAEQPDQQAPVETAALLELLGDEYTYRVLEAVVEQPRTGRELIDAAGVSKATVYRRLDELEEAGLVESTLSIASDGNHCKQFHATVSAIEVEFGADGFDARVENGSCRASERPTTNPHPPADD